MLSKFYFKFTLFVLILYLIALIIDGRTKTLELPMIYNADFKEQEEAVMSKEYTIYVVGEQEFVYPINISFNVHNDDLLSEEGNLKNYHNDEILTTFSLLTNYSNYLPKGVTTNLPPSTKLNHYELKNGELKLDVSESFYNYALDDEKTILKVLTYTFTNLKGVNQIRIYCNGEKVNFKTTEKLVFSKLDFSLDSNELN